MLSLRKLGVGVRKNEITFIETLAGKYEGDNVLEEFCANTEILCNENDASNESFDNEFYKMSTFNDLIIFDITANEEIKIPHLTLSELKDILYKKLKLRKACEQLRNSIIDNVNFLSSPQLNTSGASVVYKGQGKPLFNHKSPLFLVAS